MEPEPEPNDERLLDDYLKNTRRVISTGIFIAVPENIAPQILREGYLCTRRRRVPANRDPHAAIAAYYRQQHLHVPALFELVCLPLGATITGHKDCLKLETAFIPADYLVLWDTNVLKEAFSEFRSDTG